MELARIVAMFLVLFFHADFLSLGWPSCEDSIANPYSTIFKLFIESMSVVCVDLFVLISGWFGIKPTLKKGLNIFCTALFYSILVSTVFVLAKGREAVTLETVKNALMLNKGYWFIKCYLFLMIMSPILNIFVEKSSKNQFRTLLLVLFAFQCYFGWADASFDYHHGYSSLLFIFLYLMARYVNKYQGEYCIGAKKYLAIYVAITIVMTGFTYMATRFNFIPSSLVWYSFNYLNPLVIVSALSLMLFFRNLQINSKFINWISSSVLAVYLIHANDVALPVYVGKVYELAGMSFPICHILLFVFFVFAGSVLIDKIRVLIFKPLGMK